MQTRLEAAVAGEVRAEIKRQRFTNREIQARAGIKPRAFSYYFIAGERSIPFPALAAVCDVLEVAPSELIARAEQRLQEASEPAETLSEHIIGQLSPEAQVQVREAKAAVTRRAAENGPNG